jgi:lactose/L-arabinose transport system permease protein
MGGALSPVFLIHTIVIDEEHGVKPEGAYYRYLNRVGWFYIAPAVLLYCLFMLYPIGWLNDPFWAEVTIIIALTWRWTGYNTVFFLVGLQNIDDSIFEAAEVDGAGKIRQFFRITLPLLVPVILFSAVTSTIGTMQLFDEPNILTWEGGPSNATMTVALYIYRQAFVTNSDFGYASALSYVMVLIAGALAFIQIRLLGGRD